MIELIRAKEITKEQLDYIAELAIDRYGVSAPIDWDDLLYQAEELLTWPRVDLPESLLDPVIVKIQRYVRDVRAVRKEM